MSGYSPVIESHEDAEFFLAEQEAIFDDSYEDILMRHGGNARLISRVFPVGDYSVRITFNHQMQQHQYQIRGHEEFTPQDKLSRKAVVNFIYNALCQLPSAGTTE